MDKVEKFEDLDAWKLARDLTRDIYRVTSSGKFNTDFALRDQIRRATISISSNIAEGFERNGDKEFLQFLAVAKGSCGEVRSQLYVALDQNYLSQDEFVAINGKLCETSQIISGLIKYLHQSELKGSKFKWKP